jgi:crotonobetainyl-CoA:carnitine CoA-transferase CaiB-like acyl-CoA transferase
VADGPLRGVRVLDLTHVWAGPLAVRILADLGADVTRVEGPASRGPRVWNETPIGGWVGGDPRDEPWNRNAAFVKLGRNRSSLCLDLKDPAGRRTFLELVAVADVVIENFSARAMPALGLDYQTLKTANPRLIYVAMPGYGSCGPDRDRVAFGPTIEPVSGLTSVMGYGPDEPRTTAMALVDPVAALTAASAVVTALRQRGSDGAYVDLSLHEAGVTYNGPWLVERQLGGDPRPVGNRHPQMAPHGIYRCAGDDAWIAVACRDDAQWRALCALLGSPSGGPFEPGAGLTQRRTHHDAIDAAISRWTACRSPAAAVAALQAAGVAAGAVSAAPDLLEDPQARDRGFFVPLEEGMPVPGTPIRMAGTSTADWSPCPRLGADNEAVLKRWLGYSSHQVRELERTGVLADRPPA